MEIKIPLVDISACQEARNARTLAAGLFQAAGLLVPPEGPEQCMTLMFPNGDIADTLLRDSGIKHKHVTAITLPETLAAKHALKARSGCSPSATLVTLPPADADALRRNDRYDIITADTLSEALRIIEQNKNAVLSAMTDLTTVYLQ